MPNDESGQLYHEDYLIMDGGIDAEGCDHVEEDCDPCGCGGQKGDRVRPLFNFKMLKHGSCWQELTLRNMPEIHL